MFIIALIIGGLPVSVILAAFGRKAEAKLLFWLWVCAALPIGFLLWLGSPK